MPLTKNQIKVIKKSIKVPTEYMSQIFDALSDPTRCRIFRLLVVAEDHDVNVTDIAHVIGMSMPAISQQLKILETTGLVSKEKRGQMNFYKIRYDDDLVKSIITIIKQYE